MPSYRVIMRVGLLRPGVRPEQVEPAAVGAARREAFVESSGLTLVRGRPRLTVRFTGEDDEQAKRIGRRVVQATGRLAQVEGAEVRLRRGGQWVWIG